MRRPLHALWNTRQVGAFPRVRVALAAAGLVAAAAAVVVLGVGDLPGLLVLSAVVLLGVAAVAGTVLTD